MPSELATRIAERLRGATLNTDKADEQVADIIDAELAGVREALAKLKAQLRCSKPDHRKLRHPMCGDCQALGRVENALASLEVKQ